MLPTSRSAAQRLAHSEVVKTPLVSVQHANSSHRLVLGSSQLKVTGIALLPSRCKTRGLSLLIVNSGNTEGSNSQDNSLHGKRQSNPWFPTLWKRLQDSGVMFMVAGVVLVVALLNWAERSVIKQRNPYRFHASFVRAPGVRVGSPVRMNGVTIGTVAEAIAHLDKIETVVEVAESKVVVPKGSLIEFNQYGMFPEARVDITPEPITKLIPSKLASPLDVGQCKAEDVLICAGDKVDGKMGGSTDDMMRYFVMRYRGQVPYE